MNGLLLLGGGLLLAGTGAVASIRERRVARRGRRQPRPDYLSSCVLLVVLGAIAMLLSVPSFLGR